MALTVPAGGLSHVISYFPDAAYDRATIERFGREIMPEIDR